MLGPTIIILIVYLVICLLFGLLSKNISFKKGRSEKEGFLLGFSLLFIGLIINEVLPGKNDSSSYYRFYIFMRRILFILSVFCLLSGIGLTFISNDYSYGIPILIISIPIQGWFWWRGIW